VLITAREIQFPGYTDARAVSLSQSEGMVTRSAERALPPTPPDRGHHPYEYKTRQVGGLQTARIWLTLRPRARRHPHQGQRSRPRTRRHRLQQLPRHQTPEQGAAVALRLATLPTEGPTGVVVEDHTQLTW